MKIVCENCSAKYSIADEKVKGKVFKIRCKKCGESIVVRGDTPESASAAEPEPQPEAAFTPPAMPDQSEMDDEDNEAQTKVFDYSGYSDDGGEPEWHIVVEGEQQGPYTAGQIIEYLEAGSLDPESFIWKEGFDDWLAIKDVPVFAPGGAPAEESPFAEEPATQEAAPATGGLFDDAPAETSEGGLFDQPQTGGLFGDSPSEPEGSDAPGDSGGGLFGGGATEEPGQGGDIFSSAAADGPATGGLFSADAGDADAGGGGLFTAPGSEADAGGDIFGDVADDDQDDGLFSSTPESAGSPRVSAEQAMMTGQRSENSVLFSLSNLQALAADTPDLAEAAPSLGGSQSAPGMASSGAGGGEEASGLIDIRSLAGSLSTEKESDVDDLLSIGGGGGFGPALGAPVLAASQPVGMSMGMKLGIAGGAVALVAIAVFVVILFTGGEDEEKAAQMAALEAKIAQMSAAGESTEKLEAEKEKLEEAKAEESPKAEEESDTKGDEDTGTALADAEESSKPKPKGNRGNRGNKGNKPSSSGSSSGSSGSSPSSSGSSSSSSSPKPKPKGTSELDDLLGGSSPKPKPKPKPTSSGSSGGGGGSSVKPSLDRADVQKGMNGVASKVKRCGAGQSGTITVKAVIGGTGRVISAVATGSHAGTPVGNCAARAVRGARFPKSQKNLTVRYPFKL